MRYLDTLSHFSDLSDTCVCKKCYSVTRIKYFKIWNDSDQYLQFLEPVLKHFLEEWGVHE